MIIIPSKDVEISYLGYRDYIDMSQILQAVMDHLSVYLDVCELRDLELVIRRPVQTHLRLILEPSTADLKKTEIFGFRSNSPVGVVKISAQPLSRPILSRIAEPVDDASSYVKVEKDIVTRLIPMTDRTLGPTGGAFFYEGMKTAKILLLENFKPKLLRVVRFATERNIVLNDSDVLQVKLQSHRKSFVDCIVLVNGKKTSDVRVYMEV